MAEVTTVGMVVFEENGFPVELASDHEIRRAVASGRLRADTLVRTGFEDGALRASPAGEVAALRPFLSLPDRSAAAAPQDLGVVPTPAELPAPQFIPDDAATPERPAPFVPQRSPWESDRFVPTAPAPALRSDPPNPWASRVRSAETHQAYRESESFLGCAFAPLRRYAIFDGRSSSREFWGYQLVQFIALLVVTTRDSSSTMLVLFVLALLLPNIAATVRRLHDQDRSGWLTLLGLIPYVGWLIVLVLAVVPGTVGPNRFGPDPKDAG